jgi:hypothetical protein
VALSVSYDPSALTSVVVTVNAAQTSLTITPSPGSATVLDLTSASYDTMSEVATAVEALASIECVAVAPTSTTLASSLLDASQTVTLNSSNTMGTLTYSNTAAGSVSAFIDQLILDVDAAIERYTGRNFTSASRTEKYDGDGTPFLQLRSWPVTTLTSVSVLDDSGSATAYSTNEYRVDLNTGRLVLNTPVQSFGGGRSFDGWDYGAVFPSPAYTRGWVTGFPQGFQNVQVVYTAGYASIPDDLARVATEMVVELYLNRRTNPRAASESVSPVTVNFLGPDDLAKRHAARLAPFARMQC